MAKSKLPLELTLDDIKGLEREGKIRKKSFRFEKVVVYEDRAPFVSVGVRGLYCQP